MPAGTLAGILPPGALTAIQQQQAQDQAANPIVPVPQAAAPPGQIAQVDPAGVEANKSQWAKILDKMQDPNVQQALLTFGAAALKPRGPNDTHFSTVAGAAVAGTDKFNELNISDAEQKRKDEAVTQAGRRTDIAEGQLGLSEDQVQIQKDQEARTAEQNSPTGIKTRLTEAQISNLGEKSTSSQGAQQQMTSALAERLVATGRAGDPDQAFIKAFEMVKSTGGKTREQATLDIASDLFQLKLNPTAEDVVESAETAKQMVDLIMPPPKEGVSAGGAAANGSAPVDPSRQEVATPANLPAGAKVPSSASVAALRANERDPNIRQQFDQAFWPGAAAFYLKSGGSIQR